MKSGKETKGVSKFSRFGHIGSILGQNYATFC